MTVIGADQVEAAHRQGTALRVSGADLVTPLARERAAELRVEIVRDGATTARSAGASGAFPASQTRGARPWSHPVPAAPQPRTAVPATARVVSASTLNTLYRRGAPVSPDLQHESGSGAGRPRVAVIGAGHVGSIATLRLAESDLFAEVVLVDVVDGLAAGIALDLWHSAGLAAFGTVIRGSDDLAEIAGVDYVVMTAGRARTPGMSRTDLTSLNADIVGPVADRIAELAPESVVIVVTNPLEEMTHLTRIRTGFPAERVLGMAGVLDSTRFCSLVALTGVCRPEEVTAFALGSHGPEMVVPLSQATVNGRPLRELLDEPTLQAIVTRTRDSGAEVVSLLKTGSAYFAPGQSAARMAIVMASGSDDVLACAVEPTGQYGLSGTTVGLPVRLGRRGLARIIELPLDPGELKAVQEAGERLRVRVQEVADSASGGVRLAG